MASSSEIRKTKILEELTQASIVQVSELARRHGVSTVTIRRDLDKLEELGLLKRIRGGALQIYEEAFVKPHSTRLHLHRSEKEMIGRAAAALIQKEERVMFESGTTTLQVARNIPGELLDAGKLTIITSSLPHASELGRHKGVHVILLGGIYMPDSMSVVGPQTMHDLESLHADKAFISTDGITLSNGLTTSNVLEAEITRQMIENASQAIVVADSSKIGCIGLVPIVPLTSVHKLVTDRKAPSDFIEDLRKEGIEVTLV